MRKNDKTAGVEQMSLPELTALEARAIEVAPGATAPKQDADQAKKREPALKREMSSH